MTNNKVDGAIDLINDIDNISVTSEIDVTGAMIDAYNKSYKIIESYTGDDIDTFDLVSSEIYQESLKLGDPDKAKGETRFRRIDDKTGKKENILKSIALAIPRIIGAVVAAISKIGKNNKADDTIARAEVALDIMTDKDADEAKRRRVEDAVHAHRKDVNNMIMFLSTYRLIYDIVKIANEGDPDDKLQIKELKEMSKKLKEFDTMRERAEYVSNNLKDITDAIAKMLEGAATAADLSAVLGSLGQSVFGKRLEKILQKEGYSNDAEFMIAAQEVSNRIRNFGVVVSGGCESFNKLATWLQGAVDNAQVAVKKKEKKKEREERVKSGNASLSDTIWHKKDEVVNTLKRKGLQKLIGGTIFAKGLELKSAGID